MQHLKLGPLPRSEEAERAVLGGLLLDPRQLPALEDLVSAEDFYFERHQMIFRAIQAVAERREPVDLRTVQAELESRQQLEGAGGMAYLAALDVAMPSLAGLESYAGIVRDRAQRRRLYELAAAAAQKALSGTETADQALGAVEAELRALAARTGGESLLPMGELLQEAVLDLEDRLHDGLTGPSWGLVAVDRLTQGLGRGWLIVLGGRPGQGKTSLAMNVATSVALDQRRGVAVFSAEMSAHELALGAAARSARLDSRRVRAGYLSNEEWARLHAAVRAWPREELLYVDDGAQPSAPEIGRKVRALQTRIAVELVVVDYLGLMAYHERPVGNRAVDLGTVSAALKQIARDLDLCVLALHQLNRGVELREDKRPRCSDLRDSGALEQDADLVVLVYRPEVYEPDNQELEGRAEIIVDKHRHGARGTAVVRFHSPTTRFSEWDGPREETEDGGGPPW